MLDIPHTFDDRALILPTKSIAVVSDIHFSASQSTAELQTIQNRLKKIVTNHNINTLIFNGDTFAEFPFPEKGIQILHNISKITDIILLEGNHESLVGGFGKLKTKFKTDTTKTYSIDGTKITITHGDTFANTDSDLYIIGHIHPITEQTQKPCSALYQNADYTTLILPSFTLNDGQNIQNHNHDSPYIKEEHTQDTHIILQTF